MKSLISVRYRNSREGLVDDVTLNELILAGRIGQFYRLSEGRWVDIEKDPIRRNETGQPQFGRRAADSQQQRPAEAPQKRFLDRLRKQPPTPPPEPLGPRTAPDRFNQGFFLLHTTDDVKGAIRAFAMAIQLNPQYARAYLNRGMTYERIDNLQQAVEDYNRAIDLEPEDGKHYYVRSVAQRHLGMAKEALQDLKMAANLGYQPARLTLKSIGIDW
jgi:tetratricopeptide (TPR) repeat protein